MSRTLLLPLVLLGCIVFAGCEKPLPDIEVPDIPDAAASSSPSETLTKQLESLVELGEMFPGSETIADNIAAIKATDEAKGAALEKAYEALNAAASNPANLKAKAKAMLDLM